MTKNIRRGGAAALVLVSLAAVAWALRQEDAPPAAPPSGSAPSTSLDAPGSLYGRVTTYGGDTYEGPLRWGGGEEAFWDHYFNGVKDENRWAVFLPPSERADDAPARIFGVEVPWGDRPDDVSRPFMARFGDIARIEARGDGVRGVLTDGVAFDPDVRVTLKSGTVVDLDRLSSSDFDDGVRVWDGRRGVVDLGPREIRSIELLAAPGPGDAADRLYGTVRTRHGDFTGPLQWDREEALGRDRLVGYADGEVVRLRFDAVRSVARDASGGARVTLRDGREVTLSGTPKVGPENRGVYVDDPRFGRVLVSWEALVRAEFDSSGTGGSGPAYADFAPGRPLTGTVTTRAGRRLSGRIVYDLDESETTETLDAPAHGVDYTVPFGLVASVVLPAGDEATTRVVLRGGQELALERAGDLGEANAGVLVFTHGEERPEYVPWGDVGRIDLVQRRPSPSGRRPDREGDRTGRAPG